MGYGAPFDVGDPMLTQAFALADDLGDEGLRVFCLVMKSLNRFAWMHQRECAEAGLEAAQVLRAVGELWGLTSVLGFVTAPPDVGQTQPWLEETTAALRP